ncbi:MAG: aromatic amino acid aminotransferase [Candidatus Omnitrophica bacterium CG11_big_fil_rev_8_21_14_0_20_42_13]|uniref:Aminotransferase n=1 Tax=Candidatus Ghiorseimicrobium undicola TaxID=1974746 RepID=A0A2H0LY19_9BACT|nr:MAG: aromatic amino acid aminotransferase [Candidatus Omnitrophica bacterium CG11_big_fil_rev_8_21_14_0_20_42_13]
MKDIISHKVQNMQPSGIRAFFDLVLGMKDVISLGVGEPDFATPWSIRETGIFSLENGYTTYTSNKGLYKLRLQISRFLKNHYKLEYDPEEEILITVGVSEGLDLAARALLNPQDKVIIPQPSYVSYGPVVSLCGGIPKYIYTKQSNGFKVTSELLKAAIDKKTKAVVLNYPSNPTGASYTKKELEALKKVILQNNLICISDEIYDDLTYDFSHTPFAVLPGAKKNTVYLNGFSKGYAMTGWRIAYACGPRQIIAAMTKIHQYTMLCAPTVSQFAACEALQSGRRALEHMKKEYKRRRDFVVDGLNNLGLSCLKPDGAFYAFASVKDTGMTSLDFAKKLLDKEKVAVVPGTAFGKNGNEFIRISYACDIEKLKEALSRVGSFISSAKK